MGFLAVPVVGLASSWIMLGEPLGLLDAVGAVTTFLGIVIVSVPSRPAATTAVAGEPPAVVNEPLFPAG
jgi:drug/metabolite transporter (DMT)-like permease